MDISQALELKYPLISTSSSEPEVYLGAYTVVGGYVSAGGVPVDDVGYCLLDCSDVDFNAWFSELDNRGKTVVVVNQLTPDFVLQCEDLMPCKADIKKFLISHIDAGDEYLESLSGVCEGYYLFQIRIALTRLFSHSQDITAENLKYWLGALSNPPSGIVPVSVKNAFYWPTTELMREVTLQVDYFNPAVDIGLQPKGILLSGLPGSGKTSAAKWIASSFGAMLYRLSIPESLNRYIGDSERNLHTALDFIDSQSPCVLLLDEVDKLSGADSSGTELRLLSILLWWLQERQSLVYVVATCNAVEDVPSPLYREGRFDKVLHLKEYTDKEAIAYAKRKIENTDYLSIKSADIPAIVVGLSTPAQVDAALIRAQKKLRT